MPSTARLDWLLQRLTRLVATATDALEAQYPNGVDAWQQEIARQLARYHAAALLAGADAQALTPAARTQVVADLATQLKYLKRFGVEIQDGAEWQRGWNSRAELYAKSIKIPYWRGAVKMLPLPAMPAQGTNCYGNCGCAWEIEELDGEGNADAYWRRAKDDSCQVCVQREQDWSPVRIRGGVLV
jgi:hypothetical protein